MIIVIMMIIILLTIIIIAIIISIYTVSIYIYLPGTQITLVLIGKERSCFGGLTFKNRGQSGSRYMNMISLYINYNIVICLDPCTFAKNHVCRGFATPQKLPVIQSFRLEKTLGLAGSFQWLAVLALICLVFGVFF